jgi:hypothetical protein
MPRTRKDEAPVMVDEPEIEGRYVELGDLTVAFESYRADVDPAPLFRGLPGDRCQCPHWGVVRSGRLVMRFPDREETYTAGDAYSIAPGHLPLVFAGTEVVEFSPTDQLQATMAVLAANMTAAQEPVR